MSQLKKHHIGGITLTEVILAGAILAIVSVGVSRVFNQTQRGYSSIEAKSALKVSAQQSVNRISRRLNESKRLFENVPASNAFLARAQLTSAPAPMAGSRLPTLEETGSLSPGAPSFVASGVGNSLFFSSVDAPRDVEVLNSTGALKEVRIDTYVFNYYYLSEDGSEYISGHPRLMMWWWRSISYVDYDQILAIADVVKRDNVVIALYNEGVRHAFNASETNVNAAFYDLQSTGNLQLVAAHDIKEANAEPMMKILTGLTGTSFRYGVSPNTVPTSDPLHTVPNFGTPSGKFPAGFEVMAVGPNSARQVFVRLVLASQGAFSGTVTKEQIVLASVRDLW